MEEQKAKLLGLDKSENGLPIEPNWWSALGPQKWVPKWAFKPNQKRRRENNKKTIIIIAITIKKIQIKDDRNKYDMIFNYEQK